MMAAIDVSYAMLPQMFVLWVAPLVPVTGDVSFTRDSCDYDLVVISIDEPIVPMTLFGCNRPITLFKNPDSISFLMTHFVP